MTNYKQLCADLVDALELCDWPYKLKEAIRTEIDRARAALAKSEPQRHCIYNPAQIAECGGPCEQGPKHCDCGALWVTESEPEEPTDAELLAALKEAIIAFPPNHPDAQGLSCVEYETQLELRKARAIFARVSLACRPEPPSLGEPKPVGPTDEQLDELFVEIDQTGSPKSWRIYARTVLTNWGK